MDAVRGAALRAQENSVRNLQELYSIAVGIALAFGIERVIEPQRAGIPLDLDALPAFVGLLVTLIPFYHGAVRHLEDVYLEQQGRRVRRGALLSDFILLFVEGMLLVAVAVLLERAWVAGWALTALLAFDVVWGSFVYFVFFLHRHPRTELKWVLINLVAVPVLVLYLILQREGPGLTFGFPLLLLTRTFVDYWLSWDFYFPRVDSETIENRFGPRPD